MSKFYRQLVLCPQDPHWVLGANEKERQGNIGIEQVIRSVGLIAGQIVTSQAGRFYIGERFLQHINFMGCAPAVEFESNGELDVNGEPDWQQFSFIHIPPVLDQPAWYADLTMAKPQCPACNKRTALNVNQAVNYFDVDKSYYCCPHCEQQTKVGDINWREFGGNARTLISIVNVYPKEAIPTENLLVQLEEQTQIAWRYFYYHGPLINTTIEKLKA